MLTEDDELPDLSGYSGPYDRYKRASEEIITGTCEDLGMKYTHLRIGGVFSNGTTCIQCNSLSLQVRKISTFIFRGL